MCPWKPGWIRRTFKLLSTEVGHCAVSFSKATLTHTSSSLSLPVPAAWERSRTAKLHKHPGAGLRHCFPQTFSPSWACWFLRHTHVVPATQQLCLAYCKMLFSSVAWGINASLRPTIPLVSNCPGTSQCALRQSTTLSSLSIFSTSSDFTLVAPTVKTSCLSYKILSFPLLLPGDPLCFSVCLENQSFLFNILKSFISFPLRSPEPSPPRRVWNKLLPKASSKSFLWTHCSCCG